MAILLSASFIRHRSQYYYHIVVEPWLSGPTNLWKSWFVSITLPELAQVPDVDTLDTVILQIEDSARKIAKAHSFTRPVSIGDAEGEYNGTVDAIMLFFHYLDHCHEPTLRSFDKRIPVIASSEAKAIVDKMNHFDTVSLIHPMDSSATTWRSPDTHPQTLPPWLTAVKCLGSVELNFVTVLIWTHTDAESGDETHEAIIGSPHGTRLNEGPLQAFLNAEPPTLKLALLHGLKESRSFGMITTFGPASALPLYRRLGGVKYWIPTHHADLRYYGALMWLSFTYDTPRTLEWALEREITDEKGIEYEKPDLVQIENGGCLVLV